MKPSAPTFTASEASFAQRASSASVACGLKYAFQTLRVHKLAAAIDMTAAGTSAPTAIAANANPTNQCGNFAWNSTGIARFGRAIGRSEAIGMKPSSAINPRTNV